MISYLKKAREAFLDREHDSKKAVGFSGATLSLDRIISRLISHYAAGKILDVGCGRGGLKNQLTEKGAQYHSLDIDARGGFTPDFLCSAEEMTGVPHAEFHQITCFEVLEHVAHPWLAAAEIRRVLQPGGLALVTVPHLSRYHELPHDYFRYTEHGLRSLFCAHGFEVVESGRFGGLMCFFHHQFSFFLPGLFLGVPVAGEVLLRLNALISLGAAWLDDRCFGKLFPLGCYGVFQAPDLTKDILESGKST